MGKSTPRAPAPPDPVATAAAQGQMNADTARLNAQLNRVNTVSPYGTTTFSNQGDTWTQTVDVPQATRDAITAQQNLERDVSNVALQQTGRVGAALAQPFDLSGQPARVNSVGQNLQPLATMSQSGPVQAQVSSVTGPQRSFAAEGLSNIQFGSGAQGAPGTVLPAYNTGAGARGPSTAPLPEYNTGAGASMFGMPAQQASGSTGYNDPRVTGLQSAAPLQMGVDQQDVRGQIGGGGQVQRGFAPGGMVQQSLGVTPQASVNAGNIQRQVDLSGAPQLAGVNDFSADRARTEEALLSRLSPQFQRDRETLETRLANQGIVRGTPAFNEAIDELNRAQTDARMQAVLGGGQEQSRLFGMSLQGRQQAANEAFNQGQFANAAQAQAFGQGTADRQRLLSEALTAGQFGNQAVAQQFAQNQARAQFGNQAQAQAFGERTTEAQFGNAAAQQRLAQQLAAGQFANQAAGQQFNQGLQGAQFANDAQQQGFNQALAATNLGNAAQQQNFAQSLQGAGFNNAAQQQNFAQSQAIRDAAFNQGTTNAQLANAAQQQNFAQSEAMRNALFGQGITAAQLNNAAQQQNFAQSQAARDLLFNQQLASAQFGNQAQQQAFQQALAGGTFANQAQDQAYQQALTNAGFQNQTRSQQLAEQLAGANFQNQQRQAGIQEQAYLRQLPINEMAALLANAQVNVPQFGAAGQANAAPVDYTGLVSNNYAGQLSAYNAAQQARAASAGSLFGLAGGLGSAAIMASDRRMKRDIRRIGHIGRSRIPVYSYRYKAGGARRIGVMAQDLQRLAPDAVSQFAGALYVDYSRLTKEVA